MKYNNLERSKSYEHETHAKKNQKGVIGPDVKDVVRTMKPGEYLL